MGGRISSGFRRVVAVSLVASLVVEAPTVGVVEATPRGATVTTAGTYEHLRYTPYGDDRSGTPPNDKAFLGETIDPAQALTYLNARSTNTSNGLFIAVDPAVTKTGEPCIYASGNPIRPSDLMLADSIIPVDDCKANGVAWCAGYFVASTLGGAAGKLDEIGDPLTAFKKKKNALGNNHDSGSGGSLVCPAFRSFSGDTNVLMADGTVKPIKDIQIGDAVYALDPQTGQAGPRVVTALWIHLDTLVDLTTSNGTITTTEDHPLWNATDLQWQDAQDLDNGDQLHSMTSTTVVVQGLDEQSKYSGLAYNLTVDDLRTYFVATTTGITAPVHATNPN